MSENKIPTGPGNFWYRQLNGEIVVVNVVSLNGVLLGRSWSLIDRLMSDFQGEWLGPCRPEDAALRERIEARLAELQPFSVSTQDAGIKRWEEPQATVYDELERLLKGPEPDDKTSDAAYSRYVEDKMSGKLD